MADITTPVSYHDIHVPSTHNPPPIERNLAMENSAVIVLDSCRELGDGVVRILAGKVKQIDIKFVRFGNNEVNSFPLESVRGQNIFIIGSGSNYHGSINDNIMTMLGMVRACRDASAKEITVITPYFGYSRSDKKDMARSPIMSKLVCDFFKTAGATRLITLDLHSAQIQGFFDGPFDNLYAIDYLVNKIKKDYEGCTFIVISPDAGGVRRVQSWALKLKAECSFLVKSRDHSKISTITRQKMADKLDVSGKTVLLVDDMADTMGTMVGAARILKEEKGAKNVIAVVTHGIFSGAAFDNLQNDYLDAIYVTNTLPQADNVAKSSKIRVVDISPLCADAITRCINATSISSLFT